MIGSHDIDALKNIENIIGSAGNDHLAGNSSDNDLVGNAGNDILEGKEGNDTLTGNEGNDQFKFMRSANTTTEVTDFNPDQDKLDFRDLSDLIHYTQLVIKQVDNDAHIQLRFNQTIVLKNVQVSDLAADHFMFLINEHDQSNPHSEQLTVGDTDMEFGYAGQDVLQFEVATEMISLKEIPTP